MTKESSFKKLAKINNKVKKSMNESTNEVLLQINSIDKFIKKDTTKQLDF